MSRIEDLGIVNVNGKEPSVEEKFAKQRRLAKLKAFRTSHEIVLGDARRMTTVADESVHLVVTSPPYFDLVAYNESKGQLGNMHRYGEFLDELDLVWEECQRALIPGGRLCIVVGDVCRSRRKHGKHEVIPLHADLLVRLCELGFESLATIFWLKIANARTEMGGPGAILGKPYEPNGVVKNDVEFILRLRKPGPYRKPTPLQRTGSIIMPDEHDGAMRQVWTDIPGSSRRRGHPAPYPTRVVSRLIRISSYVDDVVLDPFLGTGTTTEAAIETDRNSVGYEVDPAYVEIVRRRLAKVPEQATARYRRAPRTRRRT